MKVVIILGPTASGKTDLAVRLAEKIGGEIVNADSMQVYRGMDVGTAKPPAEMRQRVKHHLLDVVNPDSPFSAADFRREATRVIADIIDRGKKPIIVGGTGLYLKALLQGLVDSPSADEGLRRELIEFAEREGKEELHARLAAVDPASAARLHPNDRVRIIRALEVYELTGRPLTSLHDEHRFEEASISSCRIGLDLDRPELYRRIDARVDQMMAEGLIEEVRRLLHEGYGQELKPMRSLGYKQICCWIRGEYDLEEAVTLIKRDTRHYAKRQLTWFRRDAAIKWVDYPPDFANICNHVMDFFA